MSDDVLTHFLFLGVDQLLVVPVLQLAGGLGRRHGGVEDEELPAALGCLEVEKKKKEKRCQKKKDGSRLRCGGALPS